MALPKQNFTHRKEFGARSAVKGSAFVTSTSEKPGNVMKQEVKKPVLGSDTKISDASVKAVLELDKELVEAGYVRV